ncbi:MAG: hypothetical protein A2W61_02890 [Deltaproteobacteria bacterium RIFCSPLOWO2_01_44_7]|nr:MAG: hypothetical protein A2712_07505 [Deltaproteobacteria bacterium RIFCSPHIGHO2_01_FULL_43_49]OGQ14811.1 MAG: hypothetical protein A3D22_09490 [Deltaproteobacteria bacterium RIFCSPHIGHO2_02_FULL_44_53]OGQ28197.1 MAG: hypothetical protein A3D98_08200 [Deltaproteobacteria bacterium RIFCSPHIGHO2_12_FULL_44_21]OGQ31409.1 MAG: hypothetical protein A2979_08250 [Deltaproteobacteria bacterium RIFCSPLOWO2_01_FULL_45_74]OGQ38409.1 MAG: hypothetical protein A2W61_02890 [Deltaproteobacteria bacterium 
MKTVTKAVIPAAGLGKRLWPVTKITPKELLPIVTKPSLHLVLEEAQRAKLKEIVLILSPHKKSTMYHLRDFFPEFTLHFVEQKEALGLGHAVGLAEKIIDEEPFLVLLPDVIFDSDVPVATQLIKIFGEIQTSVNATEQVLKEDISSFGVYEIASSKGKLHLAKRVVEKPSPGEAPSRFVVAGRYLFTPEIFQILKQTPPGKNGEIQLADAMHTLAKQGKLYAYEFEGKHFDIGNPIGYIRASLYFGIKEYGKRIYQGII